MRHNTEDLLSFTTRQGWPGNAQVHVFCGLSKHKFHLSCCTCLAQLLAVLLMCCPVVSRLLQVLLGSREFRVVSVQPMSGLDPGISGSVAWSDVWSALQHGLLSVADQAVSFSSATKCSVS
jgi:hypothetical protein